MVVTSCYYLAGITPVCHNVAFQMFALNALGLRVQKCLAVIAVSIGSVKDHSLLASYQLILLLKTSLNTILIEVVRNIAFVIHIVDLLQHIE